MGTVVETEAISFNKRDLETTHNTYSDPITVEKEVSSNSTMLCNDQENTFLTKREISLDN